MRTAGILMHISSLPSPYGIGTFGKAAYNFADFLQKSGIRVWQILPLGPTGYGDSPYQSFSTFAGNPYFIDLDMLCEQNFLSKEDIDSMDFGSNPSYVDYGKMYESRFAVLKKAYLNAKYTLKDQLDGFYEQNKSWLEDYAFFMALKDYFKLKPFTEWNDNIKLRTSFSMLIYHELLSDEIRFHVFLQYMFFLQYRKLKEYVNSKGIQIVGDIPIYVAPDSADAWANSDVFQLDCDKNIIKCAGVPPDAFSDSGQLWGNPLYNWDYLKQTNYVWWINRLAETSKLYDITRIDHFRGFDEYWSVPAGETTAINGCWEKGPASDFFIAVKRALPHMEIIAEDLGLLSDGVYKLLHDSGYPGMKVLEFAFDDSQKSSYLPQFYNKNCVVYTGTHDNNTVLGWFTSANDSEREFASRYLAVDNPNDIPLAFIRAAWSSVADTAIAQMQDFLSLSSAGRMNTPSTLGGNWEWRALKDDFSDELSNDIYLLTRTYARL